MKFLRAIMILSSNLKKLNCSKYCLIFLIISLLGCQSESKYSTSIDLSEKLVLICLGSTAYAYHNHYCQGLKRCEGEVKEVTIHEAKSNNRGKPCGYCYRN